MKKCFFIILFFFIGFNLSYSQWELLPGPGSIKVPGNLDVYDNEIYITVQNNIYKSIDLGKTWEHLNKNSDILFNGINAICKIKDLIFIYTSYLYPDPTDGIYVSSDDGLNWRQMKKGINTLQTHFTRFYKNNDDIYAIYNGIHKYDVNEDMWIPAYDNKPKEIQLDPNSMIIHNDKMFIGSAVTKQMRDQYPNLKYPSYIYSLIDKSWTSIMDTASGIWQYAINCFAVSGNKLFAGTESGLFVSTDEGMHWTRKNEIMQGDSLISISTYVYEICVKGNYIYASTRAGIMYSKDDGENWAFPDPYKIIKGNGYLTGFLVNAINTIDDKLILAADNLYISSDSITDLKKIIDTVLSGDLARDMSAGHENLYSVIGYGIDFLNSGLWSSTDNGMSWGKRLSGHFTHVAAKDSFIIAGDGYYSNNPYYSADGGKTFQKITEEQGLKFLQTFSIEIFGDTVYIGTKSGIYFSTDWGSSWSILSSDLTNNFIFSIDKDNNFMYAGSKNILFISSNEGKTWTKSIIPSSEDELEINDIKVIHKRIYIGTSEYMKKGVYFSQTGGGILVSTDSGTTWEAFNDGFPNYCGVASIEAMNGYMFIAADINAGVFYSTNASNDAAFWYPYNRGLTSSYITKLLINGEYLYAATAGGMYRLKLSDFGLVGVQDYAVEKGDYLYSYPAYPNPATSEVRAKIFWDMSLNINNADIKVYDIYGKEVSNKNEIEVIPESDWSGTLKWNCSSVDPGAYLIVINYGTQKKVIKVMKI
ncbi:MAG: T9SS type A sorting domain-containing protein [Chloroherpetonaceae bacterium]